MARIRSIKPEYWADEKLGPLDPLTRLVFLGLISQADDAGRLIDSVKMLDGLLFPYTEETCEPALDTLAGLEVIKRGVTDSGQRIIQIVKWKDHQKIDKPNLKGALPPLASGPVVDPSSKPPGNVADVSRPDQEYDQDQDLRSTNIERGARRDGVECPEYTEHELRDLATEVLGLRLLDNNDLHANRRILQSWLYGSPPCPHSEVYAAIMGLRAMVDAQRPEVAEWLQAGKPITLRALQNTETLYDQGDGKVKRPLWSVAVEAYYEQGGRKARVRGGGLSSIGDVLQNATRAAS